MNASKKKMPSGFHHITPQNCSGLNNEHRHNDGLFTKLSGMLGHLVCIETQVETKWLTSRKPPNLASLAAILFPLGK